MKEIDMSQIINQIATIDLDEWNTTI